MEWTVKEQLLLLEEQKIKSDVSLDFQFTSSIEQVERINGFGYSCKMAWNNNFKPIVGHKFQFRAEPNEWWNGIVDCEVLELDELHKLSYTWLSAGENTTVTWTLKKGSDGTTHLHFDQTEFSEATKAREGAIEGAKYTWMKMGEELEKVLVEL